MNHWNVQGLLNELQMKYKDDDPRHLALATAMRAVSDKYEGKPSWILQNKVVICVSNIFNLTVAAMGVAVIAAVVQFWRTSEWKYAVLVLLSGAAAAILAKISEYLLNNA